MTNVLLGLVIGIVLTTAWFVYWHMRRQKTLSIQRSTFNVQRMSDEEIALAFEGLGSPDHPVWRAVMQLITDMEIEARLDIGTDPSDQALISWHAGGADRVTRLRDEFERRRKNVAHETHQKNEKGN